MAMLVYLSVYALNQYVSNKFPVNIYNDNILINFLRELPPLAVSGLFTTYEALKRATINLRRSDSQILEYIDKKISSAFLFQDTLWHESHTAANNRHNKKIVAAVTDANIHQNLVNVIGAKSNRFNSALKNAYSDTLIIRQISKAQEIKTLTHLREIVEGLRKNKIPNTELLRISERINPNVKAITLFKMYNQALDYISEYNQIGRKHVNLPKIADLSTLTNTNAILSFGWSVYTYRIIAEKNLPKPIRYGGESYIKIKNIYFNVGAAYLVEILSTISSHKDLISDLRVLLADKHRVATVVTKNVEGVDVESAFTNLHSCINKVMKNLNTLVAIELEDTGGQNSLVLLDEKLHRIFTKPNASLQVNTKLTAVISTPRVNLKQNFDQDYSHKTCSEKIVVKNDNVPVEEAEKPIEQEDDELTPEQIQEEIDDEIDDMDARRPWLDE